jgi:hypothetical protein
MGKRTDAVFTVGGLSQGNIKACGHNQTKRILMSRIEWNEVLPLCNYDTE